MHDDHDEDGRVDPAVLELPVRRGVEHPTTHIEEAFRRSGIESEIGEALPVRGGGWGSWEDVKHTGAFGQLVGRLDITPRFAWPTSLYIPRDADYRDYWITPPPDRQRYALAWPAAGTGNRPDWADAATGRLFCYTIVPWSDPGADTRSEAGIGIRYTPDFTLGTVDFEPAINVEDGLLTSVLEYYPVLSAGSVTLSASVVLAAWQVIPGGYDLLDWASIPIARITRDQSYGAERNRLPGTLYIPKTFRKRFLVQKGRDYLFGAVGRVEATSTLTDTQGRPLVGPNGSNFKVYSHTTLGIPYMSLDTAQVYIA